jgi:hypothetical protein
MCLDIDSNILHSGLLETNTTKRIFEATQPSFIIFAQRAFSIVPSCYLMCNDVCHAKFKY